MEKGEKTKRKVIDAAVRLFNVKGYSGTSIRAIANEASVNVALISYYFGSKQGLLEKLMVEFLEGYTKIIEDGYEQLKHQPPKVCLLEVIKGILTYQSNNHQLARFVHREVTLDSTLVREVMMTYFMKEKHYLKEILMAGMENNASIKKTIDFLLIQLKAYLTMPYLQPQYVTEVYHLQPYEPYFIQKYFEIVMEWLTIYMKDNVQISL